MSTFTTAEYELPVVVFCLFVPTLKGCVMFGLLAGKPATSRVRLRGDRERRELLSRGATTPVCGQSATQTQQGTRTHLHTAVCVSSGSLRWLGVHLCRKPNRQTCHMNRRVNPNRICAIQNTC